MIIKHEEDFWNIKSRLTGLIILIKIQIFPHSSTITRRRSNIILGLKMSTIHGRST